MQKEENQFIVMTKSDFMDLLNDLAKNLAATSTNDDKTSTSSSSDEYLTREQVASMLGASFTTLWRWNNMGLLVNYKDGERKVVYLRSDVLNFIKSRKNSKNIQLAPVANG